LSLAIIYPYGNLRAIDAYFFGASASTESGLNTSVFLPPSPLFPRSWGKAGSSDNLSASRIDIKALKTYQQVYIYIIPILGNFGFINIIVVLVRLRWFKKRLQEIGTMVLLLV